MQHAFECKFMRDKLALVVIVASAIGDIPIDGRLERRRNPCRVRDVVLEQIPCHARTAERIAVIQTQAPLQHFVLFHLRWQPAIKRTAPMEMLRKFIAPVREFREFYLVRSRCVLVVKTVAGIDGKHVIL